MRIADLFVCLALGFCLGVPGRAATRGDELRDQAAACAKAKNWSCAIERYRAALRLEPDADTHYNLALALKYAGQPDAATAEFEEALRLRPGWPDAEYGLGASLYDLHRNAAAVEHLRAAIAAAPSMVNARLFPSASHSTNGTLQMPP